MSFHRTWFHRTLGALAVAVTLSFGAGPLSAQDRPSKGEQMLKYRKAVYQTMAWNFGPMAAMAQDKMPFDAKEFALRAERVAFIAPLLKEAYGPETRDLPGSKLKPEMWNQRSDFDHRLQVLLDRTSELARTAKTGDAAQSKSAFVATANACKACHEQYRND